MPNVSVCIGKRTECPESREWAWKRRKALFPILRGDNYIVRFGFYKKSYRKACLHIYISVGRVGRISRTKGGKFKLQPKYIRKAFFCVFRIISAFAERNVTVVLRKQKFGGTNSVKHWCSIFRINQSDETQHLQMGKTY